MLAVPADAGGEEAVAGTAGVVLVDGAFDAPVVRQVQSTPGGIGEGGLIGPGGVATAEEPIAVELLVAARHNLAGGKLNRGDQRQRENKNQAIT